MRRISRPCYDKFHRCPGWAGGGCRSATVTRCDGGYLGKDSDPYRGRAWKWRLNRCRKCDVLVLPYVTRYADWRWYWSWKRRDLGRAIGDWIDERKKAGE